VRGGQYRWRFLSGYAKPGKVDRPAVLHAVQSAEVCRVLRFRDHKISGVPSLEPLSRARVDTHSCRDHRELLVLHTVAGPEDRHTRPEEGTGPAEVEHRSLLVEVEVGRPAELEVS